jgi:hypothetical protein
MAQRGAFIELFSRHHQSDTGVQPLVTLANLSHVKFAFQPS